MLPGDLLTEYAEQFYGFGRWEAKIWFVGIEEAGGWTEQDVQNRLNAWKALWSAGVALCHVPDYQFPASRWSNLDEVDALRKTA